MEAGVGGSVRALARAAGLALAAVLAAPLAVSQPTAPVADSDTRPAIVRDAGEPVSFALGDTIVVTITFDQAVTVTGAPRVKLDIGGVEQYASFESASGAVLRFTYAVQAGDQDADGLDIVAGSLELNGGTIRGADNQDAVLTHPGQSATATRRPVDGVAPAVTLRGISGLLPLTSATAVVVGFSEPVTGLTESDFAVINGTAEDLEDESVDTPGTVYSIVITPAAEGPLTVSLPAGAVQDAAGNGNSASSQVRILVGDPATVTITSFTSNKAEGQPVGFLVRRSKDNGERTLQVQVSQDGEFLAGATSFGATISATPATVPVTFAAGATVMALSLDTDDDLVDETDGSVTVTVLPDPTEVGYLVGYLSTAAASVRDNDDPLTLAAYAAPAVSRPGIPATEVIEGDAITFTLVRSRDAGTQTIDVQITEAGGYLADSHPGGLTVPDNGRIQVEFAAEALAASVTLNTAGDTEHQGDGSVTLTVLDRPDDRAYPSSLGTPATIAVRDNDAPPTVTATPVAESLTEGGLIRVAVDRTTGPYLNDGDLSVQFELTASGGMVPGVFPYRHVARLGAGAGSTTIYWPTVDNQVAETAGSLTARILPPAAADAGRYLVGTPDTASVAVLDNEDPVVTIAAVAATVTEGDDALYRITRLGSTAESLTVRVDIFGHWKTMSDDTRALAENTGPGPDTTVTLAAGARESTLTVTTEADRVNEGDGQLHAVVRSSSRYGIGGTGSATVLVEDDDIPEVTLRWLSPAEITLQDNVWVGEIVEGTEIDYELACSGNTLAPSQAWELRVVTTHQEVLNHPRGRYDRYMEARHPCSDRTVGWGWFIDASRRYTGPDNGEITVQLHPQKLRVQGLGERCFLDDRLGTSEDLRFCPKYTLGEVTSARITVLNRNPTLVVEAVADQVDEGEPAHFKVTRIWNAENLNPVDGYETTFDFTMSVAGDYVTGALPVGPGTFGAGEAEFIIKVPTTRDGVLGADGSVTLEILPGIPETQALNPGGHYEVYDRLAGITPAGKSSRVATVRVVNIDDYPLLTIPDASAVEGYKMEFVANLATPHDQDSTVSWSVVPGTAVEADDYSAFTHSGSLTFAAGDTERRFTIQTVEDRIPEETETFTLELSDPVQLGLPSGAVTGTITDNDVLPVVTITAVRTAVDEGIYPRFKVTRQGLANRVLGVDLSITLDGDPFNTRRVWLFEGDTSVTTRVRHRENSDPEDDHVYVATIQNSVETPNTYVIGTPDSTSVTVRDDDTNRVFNIVSGATPRTFSETGDVIRFIYNVFNWGNVASEAPVMLHSAQLGALLVSDTPMPSSTDVIVTAEYTITEQDVAAGYVHERFYVDDGRSRSSYGGIYVNHEERGYRYSVRAPHSLGLDPSSDDEGNGHIPVWIVRQDKTAGRHVVRTYTQDQTAAGTDYTAIEGTLTFPSASNDSDEPYREVNVPVTDDDLDEPDEYFEMVVVDNDDHDQVLARGYITIEDDDPPVVPHVYDSHGGSTGEGHAALQGAMNVTVRLAKPNRTDAHASGHTVEVSYETVDGTATAGDDYTPVSGRLTFAPGTYEQTFVVPIIDDAVHEPGAAEDFIVRLSEGVYMDIPADRAEHRITIQDNDAAPGGISLSAAPTEVGQSVSPAEVGEADGPTDVTVTATFDTTARTQDTELKVQVANGTATAGSDFMAVPEFALTIPANRLSGAATFTFTPIDDYVPEATLETVTISGSAVGFVVTPVSSPGLQIRDDDVQGVVVDPVELTVSEGRTATYTVALGTKPTGGVTVGAAAPTASISVAPPSLTFTANDWSTAQTVTVTAASDADAEDEQATVGHTVAGADYGSVAADSVAVTVVDDETPSTEIVLGVGPNEVEEGIGVRDILVFVALTNAPRRDATTVRVQLGSGTATPGDDFAAVEPFDMTIPPGETAAFHNFDLMPVDDDLDEEDETLSFSGQVVAHGAPVPDGLPVNSPEILTIVDDDTRGVEVSDTALTVEEGARTSYTVRLTSAPTQDATLQVLVPANADLQVSPTHHFFTRDNWSDARTVRVTAHADADIAADEVTLTHAVAGGDYDASAVDDVVVTVTEPFTTGVSVQDARGSEGSGALEFVVTLDRAIKVEGHVLYKTANTSPTNGVTATAGQDYTAVASTPLTFAAGETRRTVRIDLLDDSLNEAEEYLQLEVLPDVALLVAGETLAIVAARGTIVDDDPLPVLKVNGTTAAGWSQGPESVGSLKYTVVLSPASSREVTVEYATGDQVPGARSSGLNTATAPEDYTPLSGTLTFAPGQTDKKLNVAVNDDAVSEGDEVFSLQLKNPRFALLGNHGFGLIRDEDKRGLVQEPSSLTLDEGTSGTYTIALSSQPTAAVGVALTAGDGVTVDPGSLTFAIDRWSEAQTVTVTTQHDADAVDARATVSPAVTGGDYEGLAAADVTVTVLDDETQGVVLAPESLTVAEGGAATWTVELSSEPADDVTVAIGGTTGSDLSLDRSALTFTRQDWQTGQTVEVTAHHDSDASPDTVRLTHLASGGDYVSVSRELPVAVTDDDRPALVLAPASLAVTEGAGAEYSVALDTRPTGQVTVTITGTADTELSVAPDTLTFTDQNWQSAQTVTVRAGHDDDAVNQGTTLAHLASGGDYGLSKGLAVTITDDDTRGVTVSPTTLPVAEGGDATYTVELDSEPTGTVTVTPSASGSTDVTVSGEALTFTATTWDAEQTVTVSAGQDEDAEDDTAVVSHVVAGADYGDNNVTAADVAVTVDDDETSAPELTVELGEPEHDDQDTSGTVTLGDVLSYTATASNTGNVALSGVQLSDLLVNSAGKECGAVAIGGSCEISGEYTVTQADVDAGQVENTATGNATELSGEVTASRSTTVAQERELTLAKSAAESGFAGKGETLNYRYEVTNSGTVTLTGTVSITDDKIASDDINCGTVPSGGLGPGGKVTCSGGYETVQGDVDASGVTNSATASLGGVESEAVELRVPWQAPQGQAAQLTLNGAGGSEDAGTLEVTVTLDPTSLQTVEVGYATADVTAEAGKDYTAETGTLTLAPGASRGTIAVAIADDAVDEEAETFTVSLSNAVNAVIGTGTTTVTITDDDTRGVTVSPATLTVSEGGTNHYTVELASEPTGTVTVTPSASGSSDVTVGGDALTFTATSWDDEQTVTVSAGQDEDAVNDTAVVSHVVAGADYGDNGETADDVAVTVGDDETASTRVALTVSPGSVAEGDDATTVTVTGTLNHAPRTTDTTVTVTVGDSSDVATEGTDYATVGTVTVTITAGQTSGTETFSLEPTDDAVDESDETLSVTGSTTATGLTVGGTTVTITDDDTRGVTVSPTTLTVSEGGTNHYTVELASEPTGTVTVTPSASGSSDVTVGGEALTFTATSWDDEQTVTVSAGQDEDAVNDTAVVSHVVAGADYGDNGETADDVAVTVGDDETASTRVALTVSPGSVAEGDDATTVTVTGTLNHAPRTTDTTVTVTVGDSSDVATEGTDYATVGTVMVTIAAGQTSGTETFSLEPTDDAVDESNETLSVTGSTTAPGLTVGGTTVTIPDDDTRGVTVSPTTLTVSEGGTNHYTVELASAPTGTVTVTPSASDGRDAARRTFTTSWDDE